MSAVPTKSIVRVVVIVVCVAIALYLIYLVRRPLAWIFIAVFLAVALSRPVNRLAARMRRGLAITVVYLGLLGVPLVLMALLVPPLVTEANNFAENVPGYARDVSDFVQENERLRKLNEDYDVTQKLEQEAGRLPAELGGAAATLRNVGFGIVNSLFALVTILVLAAFILGSGGRWVDAALATRPADQRRRLRQVLDRMATAVGGYVAGALTVAAIAGVSGYIVLSILGVPFRAPLAVILGLFSLIPLIGATIAAVIVGLVTVFNDFPGATVAWVVWAIVYQQLENHIIQPQIQKRTLNVQPFVVVVSVLFGSALLGVLGALVAIPIAASIQIIMREWWDWRTFSLRRDALDPPPAGPPADEPAPA